MPDLVKVFGPALNGARKHPQRIPSGEAKPSFQAGRLPGTARHADSQNSYEHALGKLAVELGLARENERRKIANELHDEIGQNLVLALMKLGLLKTSASEKQKPLLEEIHRLISGVIDETRSLVCDLYPHGLRDLGLQAALEWLIQRTRASYGLCCVADLVAVPRTLPQEIAETAFQTVRELLINVAKHAHATECKVILRGEKHRMLIKVVDDGKGFEPARRSPMHPQCGGFGLLSVRERISRLDGTIHIDSALGLGTTITLTLPTHLVKPV